MSETVRDAQGDAQFRDTHIDSVVDPSDGRMETDSFAGPIAVRSATRIPNVSTRIADLQSRLTATMQNDTATMHTRRETNAADSAASDMHEGTSERMISVEASCSEEMANWHCSGATVNTGLTYAFCFGSSICNKFSLTLLFSVHMKYLFVLH